MSEEAKSIAEENQLASQEEVQPRLALSPDALILTYRVLENANLNHEQSILRASTMGQIHTYLKKIGVAKD